jgi:hypothetical protein
MITPIERYAEGDAAGGLDRQAIITKLAKAGFNLGVLKTFDDAQLAELMRVLDSSDPDAGEEDDEAAEDAAAEELPEPENDEEREAFADRARHHLRRAERAVKKYADDRNSGAVGGALGSGTDPDALPKWDATRYAEEFQANQQGLKQLGVNSPEELKAHREGCKMAEAQVPKAVGEGKGGNPLLRFSELPASVRVAAETFAERHHSRFGPVTGLSQTDYQRIYLAASPEQRKELLS